MQQRQITFIARAVIFEEGSASSRQPVDSSQRRPFASAPTPRDKAVRDRPLMCDGTNAADILRRVTIHSESNGTGAAQQVRLGRWIPSF